MSVSRCLRPASPSLSTRSSTSSSRRPGVATTMCGCRFSASIWDSLSAPPTIAVQHAPTRLRRPLHSIATCCASSLHKTGSCQKVPADVHATDTSTCVWEGTCLVGTSTSTAGALGCGVDGCPSLSSSSDMHATGIRYAKVLPLPGSAEAARSPPSSIIGQHL